MKTKTIIATVIEGNIDEVIDAKTPAVPTMEQVLASMRELAFIAETVGHLREMPAAVEAADRARAIISKLGG